MENNFSRRKFISTTGTVLAGSMLMNDAVAETAALFTGPKKTIRHGGHRAQGCRVKM